MADFNLAVTVTAGTPTNLATGMTSAQMIAKGYTKIPSIIVNRLSIQMKTGGSGVGYVMRGIRGQVSATQQWRVPSAAVGGDLTAEIFAASVSGPGGQYGDPAVEASQTDLAECWVDGANTGDVMTVAYSTKQ